MADGIKGWRRILRATRVSYDGMGWALREEEAFRIELVIFFAMLPLAFWLGDTAIERVILFWSLLLVLIVELLNTAVEVVVDRIGLERHVLSGRAKDLGSAAVHLSLLQVPLVWGLVLLS
ncbi:MAG: diacylglycerol kinase [Gammaproteobacteria bacterium]|nr:diacylglycerol kinase [Gammaproteobacteria bacterium]